MSTIEAELKKLMLAGLAGDAIAHRTLLGILSGRRCVSGTASLKMRRV